MWIVLFNRLASIISSVLVILALCSCTADQEATTAESTSRYEVGQMFRDCENCPQMIDANQLKFVCYPAMKCLGPA